MDKFLKKDWWKHCPDYKPAALQGRDITILNWGSTEDAHLFFWIAEAGARPEDWTIAFFTMEGNKWEFYQQSTVELLLTFVKGGLPSLLLPPYEPGELITYEPYPSYE